MEPSNEQQAINDAIDEDVKGALEELLDSVVKASTKKRGRPSMLNKSIKPSSKKPLVGGVVSSPAPNANEKRRRSSISESVKPVKKSKRDPNAPEYNLLLPKRTDLIDRKFFVEFVMYGNESIEEAYQRVKDMIEEAKGKGIDQPEWIVQYIVDFISNDDNTPNKTRVIAKYEGFPTPSILILPGNFKWLKSTVEFAEFHRRHKVMEMVVLYMKREMTEAVFNEKYPHVYLPNENGVTASAFIVEDMTKYRNALMGKEMDYNHEAAVCHQPKVFYVNWTRNIDTDNIPQFKNIYRNIISDKVKKAMDMSDDFGAYKCVAALCKSARPCVSALGKTRSTNDPCGCVVLKRKGVVDSAPIECNNKCSCDPETCQNRVVQKGCQTEIVVFFDVAKNWTCLAATEIIKGQFLGEYVGEVLTANESDRRSNHVYDMDLPTHREIEDPELKNGKKQHRQLRIDASEYGNWTRFISHSCDPNLDLVAVYVERVGGWYSRMAFRAKRDIAIGEELTFDYFPHHKYDPNRRSFNNFFEECRCGAARCKYRGAYSEEEKEKQKKAEKAIKERAEAEEDSWSEDDEEKNKENPEQKRKSRDERNRRRTMNRSQIAMQLQQATKASLETAKKEEEARRDEQENGEE